MDREDDFSSLDRPDVDFHLKNILPFPNSLTKVFIGLETTTPFQVAKAFMTYSLDTTGKTTAIDSLSVIDNAENPSEMKEDKKEDSEFNTEKETTMEMIDHPGRILPEDILYAIQFCHLCAIGKIPQVLYSLSLDGEIDLWFKSILASNQGKNSSSTSA
jgi:hypothetical protein